MKQLLASIKAWWTTYSGGIIAPHDEPMERMTLEEALEVFHEEEWEKDEDHNA